ncbi:MAG: RIP metalloprotease RseP [Bacteroidaceae bacterium]|nr:RIP metalloprotease RseP [Bacteroidaceae bacterium]
MEIFLIRALQLILALSLLVLIHEFGHFLFARLFNVRVDKFYLFFDWKFSIFKWKPKGSDTEYGIGWIPLGGYCKIAGMIDESMDTEQMKQPAQPWEYRSKRPWQRLLIIVGGVMFNLILAILLYSMILFNWGDRYVDLHKIDNGFEFSEKAEKIGFKDGDKIIKFDGEEAHKLYLDKIRGANILRNICNAETVTVLRGGKEVEIAIPEELGLLNMNDDGRFLDVRVLAVVDSVTKDSPASRAGMLKGDSITAIAGKNVGSFNNIKEEMAELKKEKTNKFNIDVIRNGIPVTLNVEVDTSFVHGIRPVDNNYPIEHKEYGFFASFPAGVSFGFNVLSGYVSDFQYVFSSKGAQSVGMFGTIGSLFPAEWNWYEFWLMTAFLSVVLAFMNILPIPALDGGHAVFLIYEMITGKEPSEKFMERAQMVGMLIILGLFVLAMYNDIVRFVFN